MAKIDLKIISKLREETGSPVIRVKKVLEEVNGDEKKAIEILKKEGFEKMAKREDRATSQGILAVYLHHNKKVASVVEIFCETDFVAKNDLFLALGNDLAMQLASMPAKNEKEFVKEEFIKDPTKTIYDLIKEISIKTGENIRLGRLAFVKFGE